MVAQKVKNLPAMQETWVQSLGREEPLEKGMVTHSSILAWRIPLTEEPGGLQSLGSHRIGHNWSNLAHAHKMDIQVGLLWGLIQMHVHTKHKKKYSINISYY